MKCLLPFFVAIAVCAASVIEDLTAGYKNGDVIEDPTVGYKEGDVIEDPTAGYKEGDRFFYFPGDGDGKLHLVDSHEPVDTEFIRHYTRDPNNNAYWLYTRNNPTASQVLVYGDRYSVYNSYFDNNKKTVFLAHGWNGNGNNGMNRMLTEAFLENGDVNVIVLDWSRLANRAYVTAKGGTAAVGHGLGHFVLWLTSFGLPYDNIHLVGFSLGGHLVGNAGRAIHGRLARVTALDPAGPLWLWDSDRIRPTDAVYVEIMHTNTAFLGYSDPCGDADFYPNGGSGMPGCWTNSCSHSLSYEYMASSVKYNHLYANECATLRDATRDRCNGSLNPMGNSDLTKTRTGIFRVNTQRNYPF